MNITDTTIKRMRLTQQLQVEYGGETGVVPIISTEHFDWPEHKVGVVCEATPSIAARVIFRHTHKVATPEEHRSYREDLQRRTDALDKQEAERRMREGKFAVIQPAATATGPTALELELYRRLEELQVRLEALTVAATPAAETPTKKR